MLTRRFEIQLTPYDIESARFLNDELNVEVFKTAAADIVDIPLHQYLAPPNEPVIISTGMASLGEIENLVSLYRESSGSVALLHCVSNYPCSDESCNLAVLKTLKNTFGLDVG